jgi:hypothetical protein
MNFVVIGTDHRMQHSEAGFEFGRGLLLGRISACILTRAIIASKGTIWYSGG